MSVVKILLWILIPIAVTVIAWIAYRIANRPEAPLTMTESMEAHQRLLQTLESAGRRGQAPRRPPGEGSAAPR